MSNRRRGPEDSQAPGGWPGAKSSSPPAAIHPVSSNSRVPFILPNKFRNRPRALEFITWDFPCGPYPQSPWRMERCPPPDRRPPFKRLFLAEWATGNGAFFLFSYNCAIKTLCAARGLGEIWIRMDVFRGEGNFWGRKERWGNERKERIGLGDSHLRRLPAGVVIAFVCRDPPE
jgi:hypothetical protein